MRIIYFELVKKTRNGKMFRVPVETVSMKMREGVQEIYATPKGGQPILVDDDAFLAEGTNSFDKDGRLIFHGDILQDEEGSRYEVMYANGSFFIVVNESPVILFDQIVRRMKRVGDVFQHQFLIQKPVDESIFNKEIKS